MLTRDSAPFRGWHHVSARIITEVLAPSVVVVTLPLAVAAIGWSRVAVGDHTSRQVVIGALVGALIGGGSYVLLR